MSTRTPRLVLLGKQGAGKGTQASRLAAHYDIAHVSTGELFRASVQDGSPLGVKVQGYLDAGELVPDELVIEVVQDQLVQHDLARRGFVFDGFPRTVGQAETLDRLLGTYRLELVIDLDVPTEIVLHRIAGRRVCAECGATYHLDQRPANDWTCDVCGGPVVQRDDDTEDAVMRRLELWELQTLPLIQFYRRSRRLGRVDGRGDSDEVFGALVDLVDLRLNDRPA